MSRFFDAILELPLPFNMVVIIVLICTVAGVITAIAKETRTYFCHRNELELKRELLDRGLEPREIEEVMRGTTTDMDKSPQKPPVR